MHKLAYLWHTYIWTNQNC